MYIAAVEINGRITRRTVNDYLPILTYVKKKSRVGGLLMIINSEGGDANASEILYNRVKEISSNKPVYAAIEGIGASGAYWIASAARKIYAMETSLVGSIGVISIMPNVQSLMEKLGVTLEVNKIGKYKDMTSPFKEMEPEAREKFKRVLEVTFSRFRNDVVQSRNIPENEVDEVCNGLIFSGKDSIENYLADEIGDSSKAADDLSSKYSISRKVKLFSPKRPLANRLIASDVMAGVIARILERL